MIGSWRNIGIGALVLAIAIVVFFWINPAKLRDYEPVMLTTKANDTVAEKVDLKSAIITLKSTAPLLGSDIEERIYIDNYGEKYSTVTDTKLTYKGQEIVTTQVSLIMGGFTYSYDPEKKTGVVSGNADDFNPTKIDFSKLDENTKKDYGLEKKGHEYILGKLCDVYTLDYPQMELKGRFDVWQNITLHSQTNYGNISIDMLAAKIQENVKIPPGIFELPKDVTFSSARGPSTSPPAKDSVPAPK